MGSAGGGYTRQALAMGYNDKQADLFGAIMGSMEGATEAVGGALTANVGKKFASKGLQAGLGALGLDVTENFLEEAIMEPIQELTKQSIGKNGDWKDITKRMLRSGLDGALTSIIMGGVSAGVGSAVKVATKAQNNEVISQEEIKQALEDINKSEEVDIEKLLVDSFNFQAQDLMQVTEAQQRKDDRLEKVAQDISQDEGLKIRYANLDDDRISQIENSELSENQINKLLDISNKYDLSQKDIQDLIDNTKNGKYEQNQATTTPNNEILNQGQQTIQQEGKQAQNQTSEQINEKEQKALNLRQSIDNYNNSRQEGQEIFDINNEETRKEIESIQKIAQDRNINIIFDENRFKDNSQNAFYEYDKDNNVANIVLNPNSTSKKYVQNLVIHEMTHSFEGSKQYDSLSKAILDYAKSKGEYDSAFKDLMNTYSKVYSGENLNEIVEKEAVANILGEKLGDKEFVDSLVNNQYVERSTIQKIIDFVKNQINRFKGYKDQEAYWNHVKTLFEDAYNKSEVSKEGIKASVERNKLTDTRDSQGRQLSEGQVEYFKDSKVRDESGNLIEMNHATPDNTFTVFEQQKVGKNSSDFSQGGELGRGFYFSDESTSYTTWNYWVEEQTGKPAKSMKVYLDLKTPFNYNGTELNQEVFDYLKNQNLSDVEKIKNNRDIFNYCKKNNIDIQNMLKDLGYDGIIERGYGGGIFQAVAFESNQIKNIDNTNPTTNDDIRYSVDTEDLKTDSQGRELSKGQQYPQNVKEIKNIREFLRKAIESETNKEWKNRLQDAQSSDYTRISRQSPLQYKREIIQQYLDYKNNLTDEVDNKGRRLTKEQVEFYNDIAPEFRDEEGNIKTYYHGTTAEFNEFDTGKIDIANLGKGFYFTDIKEIADSYAQRRTDERGGKPRVIEAYINSKKPFDMANVTREQAVDYLNYDFYDPDNAITQIIRSREEARTEAENFVKEFEEEQNMGEKRVARAEQRGFIKNNNKYDYSMMIDTSSSTFQKWLRKEGYDSILIPGKDKKTGIEGTAVVVLNPNEIKYTDNKNPTSSNDMRFSQETQDAWNNFIEKYFKNEGTGTAIKDMKKLPEMSISKYQEVLDNAKYIPQEDKQNLLSYLEDIKKNKSSLDDFKKIVNDLNNTYKQDNVLDTTETYSTGRKEKYQKYLKSKTDYDNSALKNALDIIPANKQGRRTKEQWLNVAKQIGTEIANKSNQEIEEIAFRTWQDERPSSKESMNRQGQKFVPFNSDDWINAIYDSVNEQRQYSVDTEQQPVEQTIKEEKTRKKILNPTEISNIKPEQASTTPKLYDKKYGEGTKESKFAKNIENKVGFLTEEQKKEILKDDNVKYYAPVTNAETLAKAYQDLKENGENATLDWYSKDGKNSTAEDVAKGWILLKQYSDKGDTRGVVNVAKKMRSMSTQTAQALQAYNILSRLTPEGMLAYTQGELQDAYNEMIKGKSQKWIDEHKGDFDLSQEEVAFIIDTMQNLPPENPKTNNYERKVALGQIQKLFTDKIPSEGGKIKAWMRISMLFNPKTQVRNVAGNVGIVPVNAFSDFLGSKVDAIVAKKTGVRTLGNPNAKSYLKGAGQGLYQSYNDFKLGINTRGIEGSKFEFGEGNSFNNKGLGKALNRTENILNFVMDAGDRAFSQGSFVNSLNNQMVLNGVDTPTQEMIDIATQEALSRTWNDDNEYTRFVLGIRNGLNKVGTKSYGLGDVLIPFAKTPANLTKAIVDYSPVGLVKSVINGNNLKNAIETGQFTPMQQHKFVDDLGKALAGTMLYVIGYALAKAGIATGEADDDKDVKNFMKNSLGINSYSIKIGDKSFTYDWAQPIATPIAIMTNLNKVNKENPDASTLEKALNAVNIGTNQIMEQSFMESLNEVLNGNGEITERIQKALLDLPARAVPTFSKQIADLVDSTQRTSFEYGKPLQSSINAVKAKIPFASKTLTPVVDTLGNEVKRYGGENNLFNVFLNPSNMNKGQLSQAGKEIYNVYMQTGDTKVFPVTAPYYINYKGDKITMTSKQKADYQRIAGKYTEEVINKLLSNDSYNSLTDEEKAEVLTNVVNDSNSKAKKDVLNIENKNSNIDLIEKIGSNYYTFKVDLKNALDKKRQETGKDTSELNDTEKINILKNGNYSKKEKDLLYTQVLKDKEDEIYNNLKLLNGNSLSFIDSYFDYKTRDFSNERKPDGTAKGKSIPKTGQKKLENFMKENDNQLTYMQKLYLIGVNNTTPNATERKKLINYIDSLNITESQKNTIKKKLSFATEMEDGSVRIKYN